MLHLTGLQMNEISFILYIKVKILSGAFKT